MPVRPFYMNKERFELLLANSTFDVVIATSFKNVYYLSGALIETQRRIPLRLAIVVWPKDNKPVLIVGDIEKDLAKHESYIDDVRYYIEFRQSPIDALIDVLKEKKLDTSRLGIEMEHLMAGYYKSLAEQLPNAVISSADHFFDKARMVKTPTEIDLMTKAARATEQAIREGYQASAVGTTEKEASWRVIQELIHSGANSMRFMVLGSGENSIYSHHIPTERKFTPGDTIRLDTGAYFNGYASDIARMAFVLSPSQAQLDRYQEIYEIHQETLESVRAGSHACDVYQTCFRSFESHGLHLTMPHVGHGFGVDGGHEEPIMNQFNDELLIPGMVISIEPVYHDPKLGGYHIEDLVMVTNDGYKILSDQTSTNEAFIIS